MEWRQTAIIDDKIVNNFAKKHKITDLQARLLLNRNIKTNEEVKMFMYGSYSDISSPKTLKDIDKAINLIIDSIKNNEKICILGDYDADGVTATAIMVKALRNLGVKVTYYIPSRTKEGYGMNKEAIKKIAKRNVNLIITVDNGIAANEEVDYAHTRKIKVIVTDHHTIQEDKFPINADAVINPKQEDCQHENKNLCGAAVAWKVIFALYEKLNKDMSFVYNLLALAAIATVADIMPLTDENRIIVKEGLKRINEGAILGINTLLKLLEIDELDSEGIGFRIGPCLNADGRLNDVDSAVEILLCENGMTKYNNPADVYYAEDLIKKNEERKSITLECFQKALDYIEINNLQEKKFLVIYNESIPEGLVGLVASRVKEQFNVPTLVFTKGENCFKASGRGVEGYPLNMFDALMETREYWFKGGGHAMACGVSIKEDMDLLLKFADRLEELANERLKKNGGFNPITYYDYELIEPTERVAEEILILEPTGKDNPKAKFLTKNLTIKDVKPLGDGTHLSLNFIVGQNIVRGIYFGGTAKYLKMNNPPYLNVIYTPTIDNWLKKHSKNHKGSYVKIVIDEIKDRNEIKNRSFLISSLGRRK